MMRSLSCMAVLAGLMAGTPACAGFEVKGAEKRCVTGIEADACYHYFENDSVHIAYTPAPDMKKDKCPHLSATLWQISSRLEAPVPDAVKPVQGDMCSAKVIEVHFPAALRSETEFTIRFYETDNTDGLGIGAVNFKVYPRNLLDDVKSWANYKDNALVVKDKEGRLIDFLDHHKINYLARDTAPAGARKVSIVTGKDAEEVEGDAIYLRETVETFPAVHIHQTAQGMKVTVRIKLVDALAADDPLAQKMFAEIFKEIAK